MDSLPAEPPGKAHSTYSSIFKAYFEIIHGGSPKRPQLDTKSAIIPTPLQFHASTLGWHPPLTYLKWFSGARKGRTRGERNGATASVTKAEDMQGDKTLLQRLREGQLGNALRFRIKNNTIILNHVHSARIIGKIRRLHYNVIRFLVPVS